MQALPTEIILTVGELGSSLTRFVVKHCIWDSGTVWMPPAAIVEMIQSPQPNKLFHSLVDWISPQLYMMVAISLKRVDLILEVRDVMGWEINPLTLYFIGLSRLETCGFQKPQGFRGCDSRDSMESRSQELAYIALGAYACEDYETVLQCIPTSRAELDYSDINITLKMLGQDPDIQSVHQLLRCTLEGVIKKKQFQLFRSFTKVEPAWRELLQDSPIPAVRAHLHWCAALSQ